MGVDFKDLKAFSGVWVGNKGTVKKELKKSAQNNPKLLTQKSSGGIGAERKLNSAKTKAVSPPPKRKSSGIFGSLIGRGSLWVVETENPEKKGESEKDDNFVCSNPMQDGADHGV